MNDTRRRVAMITGSAQGIGQATALRLANDGFDIALLDLDEPRLTATADIVTSTGRRALPLGANITVPREVDAAVARCAQELGGLDVLVCCAGILRDGPLVQMSDDDWQTVVGVNLTGSFNCARAAARVMIEQHGGSIVFVSSTSAQGNVDQANYAAAKAGVEGLTKALSLELGPDNINVNAVAPGFTITQMSRDLAVKRGMAFDDLVASAQASIPLRRVAEAADQAAVISFLASPDSSFVSGQIIYATGGARGSTARDKKS